MRRIRLFWLECSESELPLDETWLSDREIASIGQRWVPKRRRDWLLGRWTAKCALAAHLGFGAQSEFFRTISILPNDAGAPVPYMPDGLIDIPLSISHRDGRALAAISPQADRVGCDLEKAEPRSRSFLQCFLTPAEIEQVDNSVVSDESTTATLIWSAKESVLKVLAVGLRVDARCVSVQIEIAPGAVSSWHQFTASVVDGRSFEGWWLHNSGWLKTVASAMDSAPPIKLQLLGSAPLTEGEPVART